MESRDIYFDNLKTILIFLVVLGHFANLDRFDPLIGAINNVIYSFHMPIFIFISGYFSKSITSQRASEIENVLYPYIVFQVINYIYTISTGLGYGSKNIFIPAYQNWYLLGIFFWRITIPYYNFFDKKVSLIITVILSFTIGFYDGFGSFLGLYRIVYFFPVFIVGYYCSDLKALLSKYTKYKYYFIAVSLLALMSIFIISLNNSSYCKMISFAYTPSSNYNHSTLNFALRIIGFFSSAIISFGLLFLVPQKKFRITNLGENTLNVFLMHMFLVFPINHYFVNMPSYLYLLISVISSLGICLMFSHKWIDKVLNPFTKLKQLKLMVKNYR